MVKQLIVVVSTLRALLDSFSFCQCWFLLFQQEFNSQSELVQQIVTIRSASINETLICPGRDYLIFEETHSCMSHHQAGRQSVQLLSPIWLFATLWTAASQASLSITNSQSLLKLMSIESVMLSNHLVLCRPLLLLPSIFPIVRVLSSESGLCISWPEYWSFSLSPSNEYLGLIPYQIDWFDFLAVHGTLKSFLQHHSSKASILQHSAFFMVWLSRPYMLLLLLSLFSRVRLCATP